MPNDGCKNRIKLIRSFNCKFSGENSNVYRFTYPSHELLKLRAQKYKRTVQVRKAEAGYNQIVCKLRVLNLHN